MRAYLALGSNLGDREQFLRNALDAITERVDHSSVWETDPVGGPEGQGAFLNMVVALDTDKSPRELLEMCQSLEQAAGRVRTEHWGPRTLDADVIMVGDLVVDEPDLKVPHPLWEQRAFVVEPLREIAPAALAATLPSLDLTGIRKVPSLWGDFDMSVGPADTVAWFDGFPGPWAVAGGWAIELFVGHELRHHHDLEVMVARSDAPALLDQLAGWDLFFPSPGRFELWTSPPYPDEQHQLWAKRVPGGLWTLEILIEEINDGVAYFRKDPSIALPVDEVIVRSPDGIPYVAPHWQLLYKAWRPGRIRPRDEIDIAAAMPMLRDAQRSWLERVLPSHDEP